MMKQSFRKHSAFAVLAWAAPAALALGLAACSGQSASAPAATGANQPPIDPEVGSIAVAPTANPSDTPPPIQMFIGTTIGTPTFPEGDTATGGQGQTIDGTLNCLKTVGGPGHHHIHLSLFVDGQQIAIPRGIGMFQPDHNVFIYHQTCLYFLHTHDDTGMVHMEPRVGQGSFKLGNVFDMWGEPLTTSNVAGYVGPQTVIVNGQTYIGNPRLIQLAPYMQITIEEGIPLDGPPPTYLFPPDYP
ncbi:MAG TPA: hypothetical protein VII69_11065 [Candidatus Eremiobacteraceae bacterium]